MKRIKNVIRKMLLLAMALAMGLSAAGCNDDAKDPNTLLISAWQGGYGVEWLENVADAYMAENENITVKLKTTTLRDKAVVHLTTKSNFDIVITDSFLMPKYASSPMLAGYDTTFVALDGVFQHTPEGESKTIEKKLSQDLLNWCNVNGSYYYMPVAASLWGLTYNADLLKGKALPRTSDEFFELCQALKAEGTTPIIFAGDTDYWYPVVLTWWAQYEGKDDFNNFFEGKTSEGKYVLDIFTALGRLRAVEEAERFLHPDSGLCDSNSTGYQYMQAQVKYYQNGAAFMANGGWLENEMRDSFKGKDMANVVSMRVPVITAITEKLVSVENGDDVTLRKMIDYIDGVTATKPDGVDDDDIEYVREARNLTYLTGAELTACIPSYSAKTELAADFLKFMYSDKGAKAYLMADCGAQLPITTDFSGDSEVMGSRSEMGKTCMEMLSQDDLFFKSYRNPIVYDGGLNAYSRGITIEKAFGSTYAPDRIPAIDYYLYDYNYYSANNGVMWTNLLRSVGIID